MHTKRPKRFTFGKTGCMYCIFGFLHKLQPSTHTWRLNNNIDLNIVKQSVTIQGSAQQLIGIVTIFRVNTTYSHDVKVCNPPSDKTHLSGSTYSATQKIETFCSGAQQVTSLFRSAEIQASCILQDTKILDKMELLAPWRNFLKGSHLLQHLDDSDTELS